MPNTENTWIPKYLISRNDGVTTEIPYDEPCFVIRGQDKFAIQAIDLYITLVNGTVSDEMISELERHRDEVRRWQHNHATKIPD
jgi:hypothetical protein